MVVTLKTQGRRLEHYIKARITQLFQVLFSLIKQTLINASSNDFFFPFFPPSSFILDIETSCLEEKSKRDHFTQLVLACLVSCT